MLEGRQYLGWGWIEEAAQENSDGKFLSLI
jgi:hypothetical protein